VICRTATAISSNISFGENDKLENDPNVIRFLAILQETLEQQLGYLAIHSLPTLDRLRYKAENTVQQNSRKS